MQRTELGEHIRKLRETYLRERQEDFAKRLHLSRVAITRYETGERVPRAAVLKQLEHVATEQGYAAGATCFSGAVGPRWEIKYGAREVTRVEVSQTEALLDSATRIFGNWSALKPYIDTSEEQAKFWSASVDAELRELMTKLRKL